MPVGHRAGKRLPILLLSRWSDSSADDRLLDRLPLEHRLIEIGLTVLESAGVEPDSSPEERIAACADVAVEILEQLGVELIVALDWTDDGRVGRELMAIFSGLVGLAVVESPELGTLGRSMTENGVAILHMPEFDARAFESFMQEMETRAAELTAAPRLWYGG